MSQQLHYLPQLKSYINRIDEYAPYPCITSDDIKNLVKSKVDTIEVFTSISKTQAPAKVKDTVSTVSSLTGDDNIINSVGLSIFHRSAMMARILSTVSKDKVVKININKDNFHDWCSKTSSTGILADKDTLFNTLQSKFSTVQIAGNVYNGARNLFSETAGILKSNHYDGKLKCYTLCFNRDNLQNLKMKSNGVDYLENIYSPSTPLQNILKWVVSKVPKKPAIQSGDVDKAYRQGYLQGAYNVLSVAVPAGNILAQQAYQHGYQKGRREIEDN